MEPRRYMNYLASLSKSYHRFYCAYCGAETVSASALCICSNCESAVGYERAVLEKKDPDLVAHLDSVNAALGKSDSDAASAEYEKLFGDRKDPIFLYAEAVANMKCSNDEIAKVGYDKPGFMEENSEIKRRALALASSSKRLLAKSIYLLTDEVSKGGTSPYNFYALALAQIKFGNLAGAKSSIDALAKLGNGTLHAYASMLLETESGNYAQAEKLAGSLVASSDIPLNAFFYASLSLFKLKKSPDAKRLLASLQLLSGNAAIPALLNEMRESELI